jgi:16S rRNA (guanine(966)-N(2))-methyltransferase RsmD
MRVIGGTLKSRRIDSPKGEEARPTSDRVRESLFSVIQDEVEDSCALDLFSGPGTLGIEAISRGASFVTFVEKSRKVAEVLQANLESLGIADRGLVKVADVFKTVRDMSRNRANFGLVFMDPPYATGMAGEALRLVSEGGIVADDGLIVVEHAKAEPVEGLVEGLTLLRVLDFGQTKVSIYRRDVCAR